MAVGAVWSLSSDRPVTVINGTPSGLSPFVRSDGGRSARARRPVARQTTPDHRQRRPAPTGDRKRDGRTDGRRGRIVWNGDESATGRTHDCRSRPVFYCGGRQCCRQRGDVLTDVAGADLSSSLSRRRRLSAPDRDTVA